MDNPQEACFGTMNSSLFLEGGCCQKLGKVKGKIHSLQHLRMLVLHVPLQVEFFELGETAEAEEADDFPAQIVAEVSFGPQPLEGAAIVDSRSDPLRIPKKKQKGTHKIQTLAPRIIYREDQKF